MTAVLADGTGSPTRMRARAHVRTELDTDAAGRARTRLATLRSQAPLKLRPTIGRNAELWGAGETEDLARVCLAAAAAGPMGGDELVLQIEVGAGTTLVLTEASATLLLPGGDGAQSRLQVRVEVGPGATFVWMPEPMIAARGCHHVNDIDVKLALDARLLLREELLLGRRRESSGRVRQILRVCRDGHPLHVQELVLGQQSSRSPAVVGDHRAVGSMIVVDPALPDIDPAQLAEDGALLPLAGGHAVLAQALSADSIGLRRQLDAALTLLGAPWDLGARRPVVPAPTQEAG